MGTKHFDKLKPEPGPTLGKLQLASCKFEQSGRVLFKFAQKNFIPIWEAYNQGRP